MKRSLKNFLGRISRNLMSWKGKVRKRKKLKGKNFVRRLLDKEGKWRNKNLLRKEGKETSFFAKIKGKDHKKSKINLKNNEIEAKINGENRVNKKSQIFLIKK